MGDEDDGGVEGGEVALEPLERGDVEVVGGLVEQQQVGIARQRPRERGAGQLAAGEAVQLPVELLVPEAKPVQGRDRLCPPVPTACVLEARLGDGIASKHTLFRSLRHLCLEVAQALLERDQVGAARQHVVPERQPVLARRALVVEGDPGALLEDEVAAVDRALAGEHPQQRGLAGPVAPGERHAVAALELEGNAAEQGSPRHVLVQRRCDHDRHGANCHLRRTRVTRAPAPWACGPTVSGRYRRGGPTHSWDAARSRSWPGVSTGWCRWRSSCAAGAEPRCGGGQDAGAGGCTGSIAVLRRRATRRSRGMAA